MKRIPKSLLSLMLSTLLCLTLVGPLSAAAASELPPTTFSAITTLTPNAGNLRANSSAWTASTFGAQLDGDALVLYQALVNAKDKELSQPGSGPDGILIAEDGTRYMQPVSIRLPLVYNTSGMSNETFLENKWDSLKDAWNLAMGAFDRDYPSYGWISGTAETSMLAEGEGAGIRMTMTLYPRMIKGYQSAADVAGYKQAQERAATNIETAIGAAGITDPYTFLLAAQDWLVRNNQYNKSVSLTAMGNSDMPWRALSALQGNTSGPNRPVCEGYARALKYLSDRHGLTTILVSGKGVNKNGSEPHMWLYAQLGGSWYALDPTWEYVKNGVSTQDWFLKGSNTFTNANHIPQGAFMTGQSTALTYPILSTAAYTPGSAPVQPPIDNPVDNTLLFGDIQSHWAKDDITFIATRGLMTGTGTRQFSPNANMTRGMFVTTLGRLAGIDPASYPGSPFRDVAVGQYYAPYVAWAAQKGIVSGTSATTFSPSSNVTRQEMALIMQGYARTMQVPLPHVQTPITFADQGSIAAWAKDAVSNMQLAGILSGKANARFEPTAGATRAEVSTMLRRFIEQNVEPKTDLPQQTPAA